MRAARLLSLVLAAMLGRGAVAWAGGNIQIRNPANPSQIISTLWDARRLPIRWLLSKDGLPGSTIDNATLEGELQAAFDTWDGLPTGDVAFTYGGQVDVRDGRLDGSFSAGVDGRNLVTFTDPDFVFPTGVLAITLTTGFTGSTVVTTANADLDGDGVADLPLGTYPAGRIFDADIVFNSSADWTVGGAPGTIDVRAVALHEVGHLLGLCHSGIRDAVMWPFLAEDVSAARRLKPDDVGWLSALYPREPALSATFGSIGGRITNGATGLPILGAHVYAVDPATQGSVVGGFSADDGTYVLPGLAPGSYLVAIEPLDGDPVGLEPFRINEVVAGTLDTSFPDEFRDANEGAVEADPTASLAVPVVAGATATGIDLVTNTLTLPGTSHRLGAGLNLFAWPVAVPAGTSAFDLLAALGGVDEIASVDRFVPVTGAFERAEHVDGAPAGTDFPIRGGEGYVVHMRRERIASFAGGTDCPLLNLAAGLDLIGVPCRPPGYTGFQLLADLGTPVDVERVARFDPAAGTWAVARYGTNGQPAGDDFPVERGEGYLVVMRTARGGVHLPRAGREITPQIAGLSPGRGVAGTIVAILGEGFDPAPIKNTVTFNGVPAAVIVATTTALTAAVPGAATSGPVRVSIGGRASNTVDFVVEPAIVHPPAGTPTELVSGQTAEASLDADGEQDRYPFTALAGSVVTATAHALVAGVPDLVLVLEDPFGAIAATDDNGGGGSDPRINNHVLAATGIHALVVTSVPGSGTGAYRVTLTIATRAAETQVSILGGDNQTGAAGAALDDPLTIFATGPTGAPLSGVPVTFVATEVAVEAGSVIIATSASGLVSIRSILPNRTGVFEIQVAIPGGRPVSFKVAATATKATKATMTGNGQHGEVGKPLAAPLQVTLADALGAPVTGALVAFKVIAGGGSVVPGGSQVSNALGVAAAVFTLGTQTSEPQIVAAFVPGRSKPLLFEAIPDPGKPAKVESNRSSFSRLTLGTNNLGAIYLRVLDRYKNPVPDVGITALGPLGIEVKPGLGPGGILFTALKTNADGLVVVALGVPLDSTATGDLRSNVEPSVDEFGVHRRAPYQITLAAAGISQSFPVDIGMGPVMTISPPTLITGAMGKALAAPVTMRLYRVERVEQGINNDFRDDDFSRLFQTFVPNALVHVDVLREDGRSEEAVGLLPTRAPVTDDVTDASGSVRFDVTLGDVPGASTLVGRVHAVRIVFTRAKNFSATFEDPSQLSVGQPVRITGPRLVVDLTDSGSGIDLRTVTAALNSVPFFSGSAPPTELPTFPDRLQIRVGSRFLDTLGLDLVRDGAFDRVTLYYYPHAGQVRASNSVDVLGFADRAGNREPSTSSSEFTWP